MSDEPEAVAGSVAPVAAQPLSLGERLKALGPLGLGIFLCTYVVSMVTFSLALHFGLQERIPWLGEHLPAGATTLLGAYALTKLLTLPRMALAIFLTPWVARLRARGSAAG
jgi:hypothetical protein